MTSRPDIAPGSDRFSRARRLAALFMGVLLLAASSALPASAGVDSYDEPRFNQTPDRYGYPRVAAPPPNQPAEQPYSGDPVAPRPAPSRPDAATRYFTETGHTLTGDFFTYYKTTANSAELLGLPITEEFPQQFANGAVYRVQYFERARLEWHPELPSRARVGLGLVGTALLSGRTFDRLPPVANTKTRLYFPETGHTISNGFLVYWQTRGGLRTFGLPLSEEIAENGLTVQYFERARFEYHRGLEGTPYAVQLSPVGYAALREAQFNVPMGTQVRFIPPRLAEGHTAIVEVAATAGITVTGEYQGRPLIFRHEPERGIAWALLGSNALGDLGPRPVNIHLQNGDGGKRTVTRTLDIVKYPFPSEVLHFDAETSTLLDPALTNREREILNDILGKRTPEKYWDGPFRMPLDGKIRITSQFATRRCYNCPAGSPGTSYHGGLDMGAAEGTAVRAPATGKIAFSDKLAVRGNTVIIDHGLGVYSLLAHNSRLVAVAGQMVQKGDVVAHAGNTGLSNGSHVHWEVHASGPSVSPLEWVNRSLP